MARSFKEKFDHFLQFVFVLFNGIMALLLYSYWLFAGDTHRLNTVHTANVVLANLMIAGVWFLGGVLLWFVMRLFKTSMPNGVDLFKLGRRHE